MKKFSNFVIFSIIIVAVIAAIVLFGGAVSSLFEAFKKSPGLREPYYFTAVIYLGASLGTLIFGSAISVLLYQIKRIADNTEKEGPSYTSPTKTFVNDNNNYQNENAGFAANANTFQSVNSNFNNGYNPQANNFQNGANNGFPNGNNNGGFPNGNNTW